MEVALDREVRRGGRPVYRQIADSIRQQVADGTLDPGERLPAIRDLARRLKVNRDTVALAYEQLATAGVVEASVGRGTFITQPAASTAQSAPLVAILSPLTERLLAFERARPRFGSSTDAVPMHSIVPDPSLFPADEFRRLLNRVLQEQGSELLVYGGPQGHPALRTLMAERFRSDGIDIEADGVVLCHGASQGISLTLRLFAQPGDVIAIEEPTYNNVLAATIALGLKTAPIPMRDNGLDLSVLEQTLARPEVKALYTIPTFHNPLGTTTTIAHRRQLLEIAARFQKPVIEDGYETDLRIDGRAVPSLAALDSTGGVCHLFSFSKSLFPGARIGAITAHGRLVGALVALKASTDLSDALPLQAALAEFVSGGAYDRHLGRVRRVLLQRRDALLSALAAEMPPNTHWTSPEGGLQVWVELPPGLDTSDLLPDAVAAGVLFSPGAQFYPDGRASGGLRLTYAMADCRAIRAGVAALGRVVNARLADEPRAARLHM